LDNLILIIYFNNQILYFIYFQLKQSVDNNKQQSNRFSLFNTIYKKDITKNSYETKKRQG
jgi:hypothetical protein